MENKKGMEFAVSTLVGIILGALMLLAGLFLLVNVMLGVTETYEERIPYQELVTVERQERYWHDEYRPISYILGAFGILGIAIGFFTHAQSERYKAKPGKERQKTPIKDPKSLPPCPLCSSRVVPTHIIEDGKRIYKCTQCDHIFDLE